MLFRKSLNATRVLADATIYSGTLYLARRDLEWFQNTLTIVRNVTRLQQKLYPITGANDRRFKFLNDELLKPIKVHIYLFIVH